MDCKDQSEAVSIRSSFYAYAKSLRDAANGSYGKYDQEQLLDFKDKAKQVSKIMVVRKYTTLIFSDRDKTGYGERVAQAIRDAGYADVLPVQNMTDEEIEEHHPARSERK